MQKATLIQPIFDRVLLARDEAEVTCNGVIIPRQSDDRSQIMRVVAIGETKNVSIGDRVVVAKYAGTEVKCDGRSFTLVCEYDILGKVI